MLKYFGFGRTEVAWYEECPPDYGIAVAIGWLSFRIGNSVVYDKSFKLPEPIFIQINYLVRGRYGIIKQDCCVTYNKSTGWYISIPYLDISLTTLDFKALLIAICRKLKGETVLDGYRDNPTNIYIENDTSIDWNSRIKDNESTP
jgi:hypothetical protein